MLFWLALTLGSPHCFCISLSVCVCVPPVYCVVRSQDDKNPFIPPFSRHIQLLAKQLLNECDKVMMTVGSIFIGVVLEYLVLEGNVLEPGPLPAASHHRPKSSSFYFSAGVDSTFQKTFVDVNSPSVRHFHNGELPLPLSPQEQRLAYVQLSPPAS